MSKPMMPNTKVAAGGFAGAATIILVWVVQTWAEVTIPAEVASAATVVITFVTSYMVPERKAEA